jgi:CBS-domain-containing membrane protein
MKPDDDKQGTMHSVHRVWTELGEDDADVRWTVYCTAQARTLELQACEDCPHLVSVMEGEVGPSAVHCQPPRVAQAPAPEPHPDLGPLLADTRVEEVMTADVYCASEELRAEELVEIFSTRRISGLPILDEDGRLVGVVSRTDLLQPPSDDAQAPPLHPERAGATAGELVHRTPVVIEEGASMARAAALMASAHVHRLLVVARDGRVVGLLTALDIARWVARKAGHHV